MGANPTQATGVALSFIAFTVVAAGFAADGNLLIILLGLAILAVSVVVFRRCKPWEERED
jgi:hypothetical protein